MFMDAATRYNRSMGDFSKAFVDLRSRSGFKTGYAYYTTNGGRRAFPFTYGHYIKIERGERLPSPRELLLLFRNLRRGSSLAERQALVRAYLRDLSGDAEVYDELFAALSATTSKSEHVPAFRDLLSRLTYHVTAAQLRVIATTPAATGCFVLLTNVPGAISIDRIAATLRLPAAACVASLRELRKAKLCRAVGKNRWEGCNSRGTYVMPEASSATALLARGHLREFSRSGGRTLLDACTSLRLKLPDVQAAVMRLQEVVDTSTGLEQLQAAPGPDTPVYLLEARVSRLFSFDGGGWTEESSSPRRGS